MNENEPYAFNVLSPAESKARANNPAIIEVGEVASEQAGVAIVPVSEVNSRPVRAVEQRQDPILGDAAVQNRPRAETDDERFARIRGGSEQSVKEARSDSRAAIAQVDAEIAAEQQGNERPKRMSNRDNDLVPETAAKDARRQERRLLSQARQEERRQRRRGSGNQ